MTSRFYFGFSTPLNELGKPKRRSWLRDEIAATRFASMPGTLTLALSASTWSTPLPMSAIDRKHEVGNERVALSSLSP
jgi:hypothetical protein